MAKLILIPRIICTFEDKSKRTHNLLPDFVLPYCNYTVKSLASVFSAYIPKSHYLEYGFQKMGKNFSYPVSEKFTTSDNDDESLLSEEFSNDLSE